MTRPSVRPPARSRPARAPDGALLLALTAAAALLGLLAVLTGQFALAVVVWSVAVLLVTLRRVARQLGALEAQQDLLVRELRALRASLPGARDA